MTLYTIDTGFFKLDGGAMFSVVPKVLWHKLNPPDENNLCTWAMRCLLVEDGNRLMLIDNGIGEKQDESFLKHYYLSNPTTLEKSLHSFGFSPDDITDMFLTHLHFDHCGGGVKWNREHTGYETTFKNATYWLHKKQWQWAIQPNTREKASFLKENFLPIKESGQLKIIEDGEKILPCMDFLTSYGHTEAMILPKISFKEKTLVYLADLIPSMGHIPVPFVMSYDIRPLETMNEKVKLLEEAVKNKYILFSEHDRTIECCTVVQTEKGIRMDKSFKLIEI